jgi:alpha-1,2-mannosyltransferase
MDVDRLAGLIPDEASPAEVHPPEISGSKQMPRWMITLGGVVFAASVAALATLDIASPGQRWFMLDLQVYRWAGLLVLHSRDLYSGYFPHYNLRFTYPPMAALIFAAVAAVSMPAMKWVVTVGSVTALAVTLWLTWGMLGYRRSAGRIGATLAATGVALWLAPVQQTLALGQVNLVLMLLIMADLGLPDAARLKGTGVGLAAGFKLTPLIFVPYLLLTRRFRAAGVASAIFALTVVGSLMLLPSQSRLFWFGGLLLDSGRTGNIAYVGNQSLDGALARLLGGAHAAQPYWVVIAAAVGAAGLLLAAWGAWRGHELIGILTCALTGLLISPVSWSHHWVWVAPALVVAADQAVRLKVPSPHLTEHDAARLTAEHQRPGWQRWAYWFSVAALGGAFFSLPQSLVPASVFQGTGAHGTQVLTGSPYVIAGLATLFLVGFAFVARGRQKNRLSRGSMPQVS